MKLLGFNIERVLHNDIRMYSDIYGSNRPIMLNLGGDKHPLWHNYGLEYIFDKDIIELPYDDGSVDLIYISDILEHLSDMRVYDLLKECFRVLKRNGYLRVTTKNIMIFHYGRMNKDMYVFDHVKNYRSHSINQLFINEFASQRSIVSGSKSPITDAEIDSMLYSQSLFETLDEICKERLRPLDRGEKHKLEELELVDNKNEQEKNLYEELKKYDIKLEQQKITDNINWFNVTKIKGILENIGCRNVFISQYKQSNIPILRTNGWDSHLPQKSLYMEVRK